ncbi:MAG TPA: long-chain-fatty-acid--CoA ligase [Steroidobacteraceae bacterium]|nr:long-chain-fatty-acid--CoA ligase [Steroidobacteraceae bacterium]
MAIEGLMQDWPLTTDRFLEHAKRWHGSREVVSRSVEGPIVRSTYGEIHQRAKRLSSALLALGVKQGDRVATLAWNTGRHIEAWYATMGIGAVCHTLNPRLSVDQLHYIVDHAEDRIVFVDLNLAPLLATVLQRCRAVEHVVVMTARAHMPGALPRNTLCYEELLAAHGPDAQWGGFGESTACGLCYTSGTTGNPKGVLYSHRSNFLHTLVTLQADVMGLSAADVVLPIVPMFHANAWGLAFSAPAVGAKLVMPGDKLDGPSVHELLEAEKVTFSAGVPTVWQRLLEHLDATKGRLTSLRRAIVGGSACPETMIRVFQDRYGVRLVHAWGMTETSPLGTIVAPVPGAPAGFEVKQGRAPCGVDLKIIDEQGERLAHDGKTMGRLKIRGAIVARAYFKGDGEVLDAEGFFDTGDMATIDAAGFIQITDRAKDVIKSGGEWISSIDLENIAVSHPQAAIAAVIALPHAEWGERPLLIVQLRAGATATKEEFLRLFEGRVPRWWIPNDVLFVPEIPLGATGKIDKKALRQRHGDHELP